MILGIDPGLKGALALYDPATGSLEVWDMPVLTLPKGKGKKQEVDAYVLGRLVDGQSETIKTVWIEAVASSPQQGVTSAYNFGRGVGIVEGVVKGGHFLPVERVTPQVWKRHFGLKGGVENKDQSRARASSLLPKHCGLWTRCKDEGRAEAALIALYGARQSGAAR